MRRKLFVALQGELFHHCIERSASGLFRKFEPPATLGATEPPKLRFLNPDQLASHGRLDSCAPTSTRVLGRRETWSFTISASFISGVRPHSSCKPSPGLGADDSQKRVGKVYFCQYQMVCRASYVSGQLVLTRTPDLVGAAGHVSCVVMIALWQRLSQCRMPYRDVTFCPCIIRRVLRTTSFCFAQEDAWVYPRARRVFLVYGTQGDSNRTVRRAQ